MSFSVTESTNNNISVITIGQIVEIPSSSSIYKDEVSAALFQFGDSVFLELEKMMPFAIQNHPFEIELDHQNKGTIRIN